MQMWRLAQPPPTVLLSTFQHHFGIGPLLRMNISMLIFMEEHHDGSHLVHSQTVPLF